MPGILVTAGDFNRAITLNVSRLPRLADANPAAVTPAAAQGDAFRAQLQAAIVKQLASQPGVFDFDVLATAERQAGGEFYMDVEYEVSTCRGEIIEGLRGRKRCARLRLCKSCVSVVRFVHPEYPHTSAPLYRVQWLLPRAVIHQQHHSWTQVCGARRQHHTDAQEASVPDVRGG